MTFFYNGGPGSSTVWLHLGSFGPKRLVTGDPATTALAPFPLVDNAETLLDVSDLVFVDAVGTGLSEAIAPNVNQTFWGVDADAVVFRDFVVGYLAANNRTLSPLFLFGESYGTTRSAVLALLLATAGVHVNGVILQSTILDYNANCGVLTPAVSCAGYLPSYGAVGAWYRLDVPNPDDAALPQFVAQMRSLATNDYDPAIAQFLRAGLPPAPALLTQLSNTTGISVPKWQSHFNLSPDYFQTNLLPGILIGRYDARVSAPFGSPLARDGDPSSTFITSSFVSAIGVYLSSDLKYTNPSAYATVGNAIDTWSFAHDGLALPDVIPDLAAAMAQNPALQVLALNGYHDLATPFFQTERDLGRLGANPKRQVDVLSRRTYDVSRRRVASGGKGRPRPILSARRRTAVNWIRTDAENDTTHQALAFRFAAARGADWRRAMPARAGGRFRGGADGRQIRAAAARPVGSARVAQAFHGSSRRRRCPARAGRAQAEKGVR